MDMTQNDGASLRDRAAAASQPSQQAVSGKADIPSAVTASAFIYAIADIFQAKHFGPLSRERAVSEAVATLEVWEDDAPFGDPDYDWTLEAAADAAALAMEDWESAA